MSGTPKRRLQLDALREKARASDAVHVHVIDRIASKLAHRIK